MKLIKRRNSESREKAFRGEAIDRRAFLRRSGIGLGGAAVASGLPMTMMRRAEAARSDSAPREGVETEIRRSICTHCSVGCGVMAEVQKRASK